MGELKDGQVVRVTDYWREPFARSDGRRRLTMFSAGLVSCHSKKYLASGVACFYKLRRPASYVMHHGPVSPEIAAGLLALKSRIEEAKISPSKIDETINVAGWNIREFGKVRRTEPAIHYIAEIPENLTSLWTTPVSMSFSQGRTTAGISSHSKCPVTFPSRFK
jgi:hypothetical protein